MQHFSIFIYCITTLYAIPGTIVNYDQRIQLPCVQLNSLKLEDYEVLNIFNIEDLPKQSNPEQFNDYYKDRNRTVYRTKDHKFVLKVWQKNYPAAKNFLLALQAHFYDGISLLSGLIVDQENNCRGYISPYLIDRTFNRARWETFGFVLEKNAINVNIFSDYQLQPQLYRDLFDALITRTKISNYASLDFCPNNIAIDPENGNAYLIDLEDVQVLTALNNPLIAKIFFYYLPYDYLKIITFLNNETQG